MNVESTRAFLLALPHVVETMQWGDNLVFWIGDKAVGGKMFTLVDLGRARSTHPVISFPVGLEAFPDLLEIEGLIPAPYLARIHWIAATDWSVFTAAQWQEHLRRAHALTLGKLSPRTRNFLTLPLTEQRQAVAAARRKAEMKRTSSAKRASALSAARHPPAARKQPGKKTQTDTPR